MVRESAHDNPRIPVVFYDVLRLQAPSYVFHLGFYATELCMELGLRAAHDCGEQILEDNLVRFAALI